MRKFIYAATLLLAFVTVKVNAQDFMDRVHFEFSTGTGMENKGIRPVDFSFKSQVEFVSIAYLFVTAEDNISLYKHEGLKTGLGVKLLDRVKSIHALDIRAKALSSVGCPSWKRSSYDVSLAWYLKSYRFSPVVELGYRFIDSHTSGLDNCGNVFLSIGFRY